MASTVWVWKKERVHVTSEIQVGSRLEIPVLSWILSCAGQDTIYGLSDILLTPTPTPGCD